MIVAMTVRFGPRYFLLAADDLAGRPHTWRDVALDQESRQAAALVRALAKKGDTIFDLGLSAESSSSIPGCRWPRGCGNRNH